MIDIIRDRRNERESFCKMKAVVTSRSVLRACSDKQHSETTRTTLLAASRSSSVKSDTPSTASASNWNMQ
uniref:Uncharacterized protein n=1 Tax=Heterorhabditis bacteriophora TaxID=37862 RepID=A0A1I7WB26_HETBA